MLTVRNARLFTVVTAVVGVAACNQIFGLEEANPIYITADGGSDGPIADSRSSADREQADTEPPATCPTTAPIDAAAFPWKSPTMSAGSCVAADLEVLFETYGRLPSSAWTRATVQNPTCRDCVFGEETAATWTPLLVDANGKVVRINVGGCIAIASGSDACGRAYQNTFDCYSETCRDCTESAQEACRAPGEKIACQAAVESAYSICGAALASAESKCNGLGIVFRSSVKAQCIGGVP